MANLYLSVQHGYTTKHVGIYFAPITEQEIVIMRQINFKMYHETNKFQNASSDRFSAL